MVVTKSTVPVGTSRKVDEINGRHIHTFPSEFVTPITTCTLSVAFYESMVVFERDVTAPVEAVEAGGNFQAPTPNDAATPTEEPTPAAPDAPGDLFGGGWKASF